MGELAIAPRDLAEHYKTARKRLWLAGCKPAVTPAKPVFVRDANAEQLAKLRVENEIFRAFLRDHCVDVDAVLAKQRAPIIFSVQKPVENTEPEPESNRQPTVALIIKVVCEHFGLTPLELVSRRRHAKVMIPRQIAIYLARNLTARSTPFIGSKFGGRDHTTVLHAISRIGGYINHDPEFSAQVDTMRAKITGAL